MFLSQVLDSLVLVAVLFNKLFHDRVFIDIKEVVLQSPGEIINKIHILVSDALHHVAYIVAPASDISLGVLITLDCMLSSLSKLIKFLHRSDVALVNVLHILLADETLKALEGLVLAREEVETATVNVASLTLGNTSAGFSSLDHSLDDLERSWQLLILH